VFVRGQNKMNLYGTSLSLLTDLYQLTMAYGYWKSGAYSQEAAFHLHFRKAPFGSGFTIACGLADAIAFIQNFRFDESDIEYLSALHGNDGNVLFERAFLNYLRDLKFTCDVDAIPEGTPVFPYEPLIRVTGPIIECQLLETALLNMINFQTLIATKAARVCLAARGEPVLEFGARRAQGFDGALSASRAAFVGGVAATSNVLAGKLFGIPVKGTHAHSWVMAFDDELTAFQKYAAALPNNCVFLVDTYDTLEGVRRAIEVGKTLRETGHALIGVRLDSGDLAQLSIEARNLLDAAGFEKAQIFASNDLDETIIESLKIQGAKIAVWGVGTRLVTGGDQSALGGVYKLSAIREDENEAWQPRVKISEQTIKISNPGLQQVRRFFQETPDGRRNLSDAIYDASTPLAGDVRAFDQLDITKSWTTLLGTPHEDLLIPIFRSGQCVYDLPALPSIQARARRQMEYFPAGVKRFVNPHLYPVGIEAALQETKLRLIARARAQQNGSLPK
jgi:nicotinate phosphoribosyltransferase